MARKEVEKRLFVEVDVRVIMYSSINTLLASGPEGAYSDLGSWGGLEELW